MSWNSWWLESKITNRQIRKKTLSWSYCIWCRHRPCYWYNSTDSTGIIFFIFLNISAHFHISRSKPTKTPPQVLGGEKGDTVSQQLWTFFTSIKTYPAHRVVQYNQSDFVRKVGNWNQLNFFRSNWTFRLSSVYYVLSKIKVFAICFLKLTIELQIVGRD